MCVYFCFGGLLVLIAQNVIPGVFFFGGGAMFHAYKRCIDTLCGPLSNLMIIKLYYLLFLQ